MLAFISEKFEAPHRRILVTDVTRMKNATVCTAGIDLATGQMVRPLQPDGSNWEEEKWVQSGFYRPGNVLALEAAAMPDRILPHRHEDFFVSTVHKLGNVSSSELFAASSETSVDTVEDALGPHLLEKNMYSKGPIAVRCSASWFRNGRSS